MKFYVLETYDDSVDGDLDRAMDVAERILPALPEPGASTFVKLVELDARRCPNYTPPGEDVILTERAQLVAEPSVFRRAVLATFADEDPFPGGADYVRTHT